MQITAEECISKSAKSHARHVASLRISMSHRVKCTYFRETSFSHPCKRGFHVSSRASFWLPLSHVVAHDAAVKREASRMCVRRKDGYLQNDAPGAVLFVFPSVPSLGRGMVLGFLVVDVVVVVGKLAVVPAEHLPAEINKDLVDVG